MIENFNISYETLGQKVEIFFNSSDFEEYWFCKKEDKIWLRDKSLKNLKGKIKNLIKKENKFERFDAYTIARYGANVEIKKITITSKIAKEDGGGYWASVKGVREKIYDRMTLYQVSEYNEEIIYRMRSKKLQIKNIDVEINKLYDDLESI